MRIILLSGMDQAISFNILKCLHQSGNSAIVIGTHLARGIALSSYCTKFYEIQGDMFNSDNKLLEMIYNINLKDKGDVLIPVDLEAMCYIGNNIAQIKKIIPTMLVSPANLIQQLHNKWEFYLLLSSLDMPTPRTFLLDCVPLSNDSFPLEFPVLTKPMDGGGGEGIQYFKTKKAFNEDILGLTLPLIVQEYIPGQDIDLSAFCINGSLMAWTIQEQSLGSLNFVKNEEALKICTNVLNMTNYSGVVHFDLRIDARDNSLKFLECNPRFWGSVYESAKAGVNFPELAAKVAISGEMPLPQSSFVIAWIPFKKKELLFHPIFLIKHLHNTGPFLFDYLNFLKDNAAAELYRIIYARNKSIGEKWLKCCLKTLSDNKIEYPT